MWKGVQSALIASEIIQGKLVRVLVFEITKPTETRLKMCARNRQKLLCEIENTKIKNEEVHVLVLVLVRSLLYLFLCSFCFPTVTKLVLLLYYYQYCANFLLVIPFMVLFYIYESV